MNPCRALCIAALIALHFAIAAPLARADESARAAQPAPAPNGAPASQPAKLYVCPPCEYDCHQQTFDAAGRCPVCNMRLVEMPKIPNVAILIWDGVEVLDFTGPAEVFAAARAFGRKSFNVYTVAPAAGPITSQGFITITPNYTLATCPTPDILVIPGGNTGPLLENAALLDFVRETSLNGDAVMSVCTGAFVLAKCGLLDDISATTWHGAIDRLREAAPAALIRPHERICDNDDIITTAGVSAGIDGALHLVGRLLGGDVAQKTADYMQYIWIPEFDHGFVDYVRNTGISPRLQPYVDNFIVELERRLASRRLNAGDLTADPAWLFVHEQPKFREALRRWADRSNATLVTPEEPGERLIVSGTVKNPEGRPVAGALIYVYHTGQNGRYSSGGGNAADMGDALNPRLFAYLRTGRDGAYEFTTIRPGGYPQGGPPAHIHYEISADGHADLITELMFEDDPRMTPSARAEFERAGFIITKPADGETGPRRVTCDVVLKPKDATAGT